jgi:hypothetical protein
MCVREKSGSLSPIKQKPAMPIIDHAESVLQTVFGTAVPSSACIPGEHLKKRWLSACQLPVEAPGTARVRTRTMVGKRRRFHSE